MIFLVKKLEKATTMMTLGSFSIYTHTLSTNVVDVYIRNRLNDVWTSDSWERSFDNHENLISLLERQRHIVARMKEEKAKNYHGLVVHLQIPFVVHFFSPSLRLFFFISDRKTKTLQQQRQLGQSDVLEGSETSCYLSFSHNNCVIKTERSKKKFTSTGYQLRAVTRYLTKRLRQLLISLIAQL